MATLTMLDASMEEEDAIEFAENVFNGIVGKALEEKKRKTTTPFSAFAMNGVKRRRLGVSASAHDVILGLRKEILDLNYAMDEKDAKIERLQAENLEMAAKIIRLRKIVNIKKKVEETEAETRSFEIEQ